MRNIYALFDLIGKNLKDIRTNVIRKSQEKFAEETEMSRSFLSQIESPKVNAGVSLDTLFNIAQKYNIDIRDFFKGYESLMDSDMKDDN